MGKSEKKLQDLCIKYLKEKGIYYINQYGNGMTAKGCPDLVCSIKGLFVTFELKVGSNDLQEDQKLHKLWIERSEGLHFSPYTLEEFIKIVEDVSNGKYGFKRTI